MRPARTWCLAGLFFLGLGTCSDPRAPWLASRSEAAGHYVAPALGEVLFVDRELIPTVAPDPVQLVRTNPFYAAVVKRMQAADLAERMALAADLNRLAMIGTAPRFVLVDTSSARLWMVEGGRIAGSMKVVVGKSGMETPMMAALIRHAVLNPYWNLPPDLVRERILHNVLIDGPAWLHHAGLEPVSDYGPDAVTLDPQAIDWIAGATGDGTIGLRQRPGPRNTMGAVKFMFPNRLGIYLHDTPERQLFRAADRQFSSGCVRLEQAAELYRWLLGSALPAPDPRYPEQRVDLPAPVPVFILNLPSLKRAALPENAGRTVA